MIGVRVRQLRSSALARPAIRVPAILAVLLGVAQAVTALAITALATVAFATPAVALPAPRDITLDQALTSALRQSPLVKNAESDVARAEAEDKTSWGWALRSLGAYVGVAPPLGAGPGSWTTNAGINVTLNLGDLLIGGPAAMRDTRSRLEVARRNLERVKLDVAAHVAGAHAAYTASRQILELRRKAEEAADQEQQAMHRQFARGSTTGTDLRRAQLAWNQAAADVATAQSEVHRTWAALLAVMGDGSWLEKQARGGVTAQETARDTPRGTARDTARKPVPEGIR